jgi:hypothetical protein
MKSYLVCLLSIYPSSVDKEALLNFKIEFKIKF